jgi:plasmid stabilization system protein ParE
MTKRIVWSPLSEKDFSNILNYLSSNWDQKVSVHFITLTQNALQQIATYPKQFPLINKIDRVRKCVLTKHNTLFYRENPTQIQILRIYDTRQNPNDLCF